MMTANEIRSAFLRFFEEKQHHIVPSAPMVVKGDPTLMFTNAGMNQFKELFLGNSPITHPRVADTQKCLRVSGKHNDLEEVGQDTYHHTMFEMLGNWSFGDYFKKEAIAWAWELLTRVYGLDKDRLYATYFEGSDEIGTDTEALAYWKEILPPSHILPGNKKDNFWEMGETGPCGPCSEIHIDLRDAEARARVDGASLVNQSNPLVIEIWNLVFMQYNRKADGSLELLPKQHIDTGMGFERLCMAIQGKTSNYDTDIFQHLIHTIEGLCGHSYGADRQTDVAMRVIADHLRAISFSIADGQLPSNVKAGYVIRRILRRAVRYGYTFLGLKEPFLCRLVPALAQEMGGAYPELVRQGELIEKVIRQEEEAFLRTLDRGIRLFEQYVSSLQGKVFSGEQAFLLYDSYGFPLDLTTLMAKEQGIEVDIEEFNRHLSAQKERARKATLTTGGDWVELRPFHTPEFLGYDCLSTRTHVLRWRQVKVKNKDLYQIVLAQTPFYAEKGGQVGDTGYLENAQGERIQILNTLSENNLTVHMAAAIAENMEGEFFATVDVERRQAIANNHSATHLLHYALRQVLGEHVEQKGSMVAPDYFRFDFSHFAKIEEEDMRKIERLVNRLIREDHSLDLHKDVPLDQAKAMGAMALFGEQYGNKVRVVRFGPSIELCGGTHTASTGKIGMLKVVSEGAIAAGIRRIEAITGAAVEDLLQDRLDLIAQVRARFNNPSNLLQAVNKHFDETEQLRKALQEAQAQQAAALQKELAAHLRQIHGAQFAVLQGEYPADMVKQLAFGFKDQAATVFVGATLSGGKPSLTLAISPDLVAQGYKAGAILRDAAKLIQGGGGGQDFYATAGGKNPQGLAQAVDNIIDHFAQ